MGNSTPARPRNRPPQPANLLPRFVSLLPPFAFCICKYAAKHTNMAIVRTLRLLLACVALLSMACMLRTAHAAPELSDLKDVKIKGNGQHYITTDSGQDWVVLGDAASSTRFFLNEATQQIVYTDPRVAPPPEPGAEEEVEGVQRDGDTGAYYVEVEVQEGAVKRW